MTTTTQKSVLRPNNTTTKSVFPKVVSNICCGGDDGGNDSVKNGNGSGGITASTTSTTTTITIKPKPKAPLTTHPNRPRPPPKTQKVHIDDNDGAKRKRRKRVCIECGDSHPGMDGEYCPRCEEYRHYLGKNIDTKSPRRRNRNLIIECWRCENNHRPDHRCKNIGCEKCHEDHYSDQECSEIWCKDCETYHDEGDCMRWDNGKLYDPTDPLPSDYEEPETREPHEHPWKCPCKPCAVASALGFQCTYRYNLVYRKFEQSFEHVNVAPAEFDDCFAFRKPTIIPNKCTFCAGAQARYRGMLYSPLSPTATIEFSKFIEPNCICPLCSVNETIQQTFKSEQHRQNVLGPLLEDLEKAQDRDVIIFMLGDMNRQNIRIKRVDKDSCDSDKRLYRITLHNIPYRDTPLIFYAVFTIFPDDSVAPRIIRFHPTPPSSIRSVSSASASASTSTSISASASTPRDNLYDALISVIDATCRYQHIQQALSLRKGIHDHPMVGTFSTIQGLVRNHYPTYYEWLKSRNLWIENRLNGVKMIDVLISNPRKRKPQCVFCLKAFPVLSSIEKKTVKVKLCNGDDAIMRLPCKHLLHKKCLLEWFLCSNGCPTCMFRREGEL